MRFNKMKFPSVTTTRALRAAQARAVTGLSGGATPA